MTLKDAIAQDPRGTVRVGTQNGSGFLYIGDRSGIAPDLLEREVVETYDGIEEDHAVFIVTGNEDGSTDYWGAPHFDSTRITPEFVLGVVSAVYKDAFRELETFYRRLLLATKVEEAQQYAAETVRIERWISADVYGVFENGADTAIKQTRRDVEKRIRAERKAGLRA